MMTRRLTALSVFFFVFSGLYGQSPADPVSPLDGAVRALAAEINRQCSKLPEFSKIPAGEARKIVLGQWAYRDSASALGSYWAAQLAEELTNIPNRPFVLISGGAVEWVLSGEILEIPGAIRVYTRLSRAGDHAIMATFQSDLEWGEHIAEMLSDSDGGRGRTPLPTRDAWEPDGMENPLVVEIASGDGGPVINRTIHAGNDEDFFLLTPDKDSTLVMETTGNMDTYMELYDAGSRDRLSHNDDGGSGSNARIRYQARAGGRYIARAGSYEHDSTGRYGFRAWLVETVRMTPDEYEDDNDFDTAKDMAIGTPQRHTFTTGDDVDWVRFRADQAGRYTIRARGVDSNRLDTYIELYDGDCNSIDDDDDGGERLDSRLSMRLQPGTYYLKVECLDDEPGEPYTISITVTAE
jgi:hypothetical protein